MKIEMEEMKGFIAAQAFPWLKRASTSTRVAGRTSCSASSGRRLFEGRPEVKSGGASFGTVQVAVVRGECDVNAVLQRRRLGVPDDVAKAMKNPSPPLTTRTWSR